MEEEENSASRFSFWLAIDADGRVELSGAKLEMGQGISTALAVLVAEEFEIDPADIRIRAPSSNEPTPEPHMLDTGGSSSVSKSWLPARTATATAREMLLAAAAARWSVPNGECVARDGRIEHAASSRRAGFGALAAAAARLPVPANPLLRGARRFRRIGHPTARLEGPEIVTGRARFSCDVRRAGQRFAVIARPPTWNARLLELDDFAARATPGWP